MNAIEGHLDADLLVILREVHHVDNANAWRVHQLLVEELLQPAFLLWGGGGGGG